MPAGDKSTTTRAPSPQARGLLSRLVRLLGAGCLIFAIFILLLEVAGRTLDPLGVSYYPETAKYLDTLIIEEPIGYRNRPGLEGQFWGTQVSINSLGLRDRDVSSRPAEDEYRILMLGDSVVFGLGLADADSIPRQLEQQLNRTHDDRTYRVINMGVPSYNTEQELEQLRTLGLRLDPDLVLLVFSLNDVQPKMWVFDRRESWLVDIAQRSYALSLLAVFYWELRTWLTGHDSRAPYERVIEDDPGWPNVKSSLARIAALCAQHGIPLVLFLQSSYPALEAFAKGIGVPSVVLAALAPDQRISQVNSHPNQAGAEQLSTLMRESLRNLGLD